MAEMEQQSTELKLAVPWGHIAAKTYGSPTGKFVLMVHGILDNMGSFTRLLKHLPMDYYYYVCVDLPGHGHSSHFPSWMMLEFLNYVHTIYYILQALQWKTCTYIGHSMGAQLGVFFSILYLHRIEKLIALDGLVPIFTTAEDTFIKSLKELFSFSTKIQDAKSNLYIKEEVLYALKNMRFSALNSDAAEALFERAVTEIDGKYKYTRDTRLRAEMILLMSLKKMIYIVRNISVPFYLFIASHGMQKYSSHITEVIKSINSKNFSQFYIKGNHDFHNNNPERVAPLICKILHDNSSKL